VKNGWSPDDCNLAHSAPRRITLSIKPIHVAKLSSKRQTADDRTKIRHDPMLTEDSHDSWLRIGSIAIRAQAYSE
jgi:hypothetical protein